MFQDLSMIKDLYQKSNYRFFTYCKYGLETMELGMKFLPVLTYFVLGFCAIQAKAQSDIHQGKYQKNLTYRGPATGDEIIYTLYLPPRYAKDKGPFPLIIFLHGAG